MTARAACLVCNEPLSRRSGRGRPPTYSGSRCRKRAETELAYLRGLRRREERWLRSLEPALEVGRRRSVCGMPVRAARERRAKADGALEKINARIAYLTTVEAPKVPPMRRPTRDFPWG
jgi:hypothetical protein